MAGVLSNLFTDMGIGCYAIATPRNRAPSLLMYPSEFVTLQRKVLASLSVDLTAQTVDFGHQGLVFDIFSLEETICEPGFFL